MGIQFLKVIYLLKESSFDVDNFFQLLECDKEEFLKAMTHRTIEAREDVVLTPLSVELVSILIP